MSKILELKYDVGDVGYTMLGDTPYKVEVTNFSLSYDKNLPIDKRIEYEVRRLPLVESTDTFVVSLYCQSFVNTYRGLDEIFDTKEELIKSLTNKIEEL